MKLIKCIIRPEKLEDVMSGLANLVTGMTICEVRGHGRQKGKPVIYRGAEYQVTLLPKIGIEIVCDDNRVDEIVQALTATARTGSIGDGRIFIHAVESAYHVRTGFMDLD
jgi:nitrogen regulatory protein PII